MGGGDSTLQNLCDLTTDVVCSHLCRHKDFYGSTNAKQIDIDTLCCITWKENEGRNKRWQKIPATKKQQSFTFVVEEYRQLEMIAFFYHPEQGFQGNLEEPLHKQRSWGSLFLWTHFSPPSLLQRSWSEWRRPSQTWGMDLTVGKAVIFPAQPDPFLSNHRKSKTIANQESFEELLLFSLEKGRLVKYLVTVFIYIKGCSKKYWLSVVLYVHR